MVNVPGADVQNVAPPTLALLALATAQLGGALLLRGAARGGYSGQGRGWPWSR